MSNKWEYNCPQYVDFHQLHELDNTDTEAFFDNCDLDSAEISNSLNSSKKRRQQPYECSVGYLPTSVAATQTSVLKAKNDHSNAVVSTTSNLKQEKKVVPKVPNIPKASTSHAASSTSAYVGRKIATARRVSKQHCDVTSSSIKVSQKPQKKADPAETKSSVPVKGRKRSGSFGNPRPLKKKFTCPTTPQCLKRSMMKNKNFKSSEDLELERIAELRKQMGKHLHSNKVAMKKIIRPSALKPLPASSHVKTSVKKGYSFKKAAVEKRSAVNFAKEAEKSAFSFKMPKSPLKFQDAIETSVMQSPGLQRCSTPYPTKVLLNKKNMTAVGSTVKNKALGPAKNNKAPAHKISKNKFDFQFSHKQDTFGSQPEAPKLTKNMPQKKNQDKKSEPLQMSRPVKPLAAKVTTCYSGLPFIRKQRGPLAISNMDADLSSVSMKSVEIKPTPRKKGANEKNVKKEVVLPNQENEGTENHDGTQTAEKEMTESTVGSHSISTWKGLPSKDIENSIDRKADGRAKAWRKKVEDEMQQQRKALLKEQRSHLLRSTKKGKNPLFDVTSKYNNKQKGTHREILKRSQTDIMINKGYKLRNNTSKLKVQL